MVNFGAIRELKRTNIAVEIVLLFIPIMYYGLTGFVKIYLMPGISTLLANWAIGATIVLFLWVLLENKKRASISPLIWVLVISLLMSFLISYAIYRDLALPGLKAIGQPIFFGLAAFVVYKDSITIGRALFLIKVVMIANLVVGLRQVITGLTGPESLLLVNSGSSYLVQDQTRVLGLQNSGQEFAFLAGIALVCGVTDLQRKSHAYISPKGQSLISWTLIILGAIASVAALQRGTILGLLLAFAIVAFGAFRKSYGLKFLLYSGAILAVILVVGLVAFPDRYSLAFDRLVNSQSSNDVSFQTRSALTVPIALNLIAESPLFGYGLGTSGPNAALLHSGPLASFPLGGLVPDNGYFFLLLQFGFFGILMILLLVLRWAFRNKIFSDTLESEFEPEPNPYIFYLLGCMVAGTFIPLNSPMSLLFLLALGFRHKVVSNKI